MSDDLAGSSNLAIRIRVHALSMSHKANASHIGTCLSMANILVVLWSGVLRTDSTRPGRPDRDRFILSKGYDRSILYPPPAERGLSPREWLEAYCQDGGKSLGHITSYVCVAGRRIGINDEFCRQLGSQKYLRAIYGLSADSIIRVIRSTRELCTSEQSGAPNYCN